MAFRTYERGDRVYVRAQQVWLILVSTVMNGRGRITYGNLAKAMGFDDGRVGFTLSSHLGIVGQYCLAHGLPPLNAIVINESTGTPGHDVLLRKGKTVDQEQLAVTKFDWFSIRPPTTGTLRAIAAGTYEDA